MLWERCALDLSWLMIGFLISVCSVQNLGATTMSQMIAKSNHLLEGGGKTY